MTTMERQTEVPLAVPVKTRAETDVEGYRKFSLERRQRRKSLRTLAKKNGHKLGHNNRKCKRCNLLRDSGFSNSCTEQPEVKQ